MTFFINCSCQKVSYLERIASAKTRQDVDLLIPKQPPRFCHTALRLEGIPGYKKKEKDFIWCEVVLLVRFHDSGVPAS